MRVVTGNGWKKTGTGPEWYGNGKADQDRVSVGEEPSIQTGHVCV
jgi:hypothetical protein